MLFSNFNEEQLEHIKLQDGIIEQSVGRGLRLPYGKRVGVPSVDRLIISSIRRCHWRTSH